MRIPRQILPVHSYDYGDNRNTNEGSSSNILSSGLLATFGILVCLCVIIVICKRKALAKVCKTQQRETNRYPIHPIVTPKVRHSKNKRHTPPTRTQQISPFLVPTPTPRSLNSTEPSHALRLTQPSHIQQPTYTYAISNANNANSITTNNSVLATDVPPSYNASQTFKDPKNQYSKRNSVAHLQ